MISRLLTWMYVLLNVETITFNWRKQWLTKSLTSSLSETWLDNSVTLKFQVTIFIVLTPQTRKVVESVPRFWGLIKLRLWATSHASRLLGSINYGWKFKCDWKPEVVHNLYSLQATRHFIACLRYWHHRFVYLYVFLQCTCIHPWS